MSEQDASAESKHSTKATFGFNEIAASLNQIIDDHELDQSSSRRRKR